MVSEKDLVIMSHLRQDSRIKLTKMSRLTRLPVSTIFDRIKHHEGELIRQHICLLDFAKLGFHTRANVMFSIAKEDRDGFKEYIGKNQNVNSVYKINNGFDFLAEVVFRNISDLEDFLDFLDEKFDIKKKVVHYIINDIKRESFMANPDTVGLLEIS